MLKLLLAAIALTATAPALAKAPPTPFGYTFTLTPEQGPTDPRIEQRHSAAFNACQQRAVTTRDTVDCYGQEFTRQDAALNRAWRAARARVKARTLLLAAQRSWIARRDLFCKSRADKYQGGTIMPVIYASCRVEQTIRRTMWLERLR